MSCLKIITQAQLPYILGISYLEGHEAEIAGFVWFQGWNDMYGKVGPGEYEENLVNLIMDVRKEFNLPNLPVVVGETGNGNYRVVRSAQEAATKRPELKGNAAFVPTFKYRRPKEDSPNVGHGHHWFGNAESYFLIGDAMGETMRKLLGSKP